MKASEVTDIRWWGSGTVRPGGALLSSEALTCGRSSPAYSAVTYPFASGHARAVDVFGWRPDQVEAASAYYAEFTEEIDAEIAADAAAAEEAEVLWRRGHDLLAG